MSTPPVMHHLRHTVTEPEAPPRWRRGLEVALLIVGLIALVVGLVILLGGDDQYVGLWIDELSWRVGDIPTRWGVGLFLGGLACLGGAGVSYVARHR